MITKGERTITLRALLKLERKLLKQLEGIRCTIALFEDDDIASTAEQASIKIIDDIEQLKEEGKS